MTDELTSWTLQEPHRWFAINTTKHSGQVLVSVKLYDNERFVNCDLTYKLDEGRIVDFVATAIHSVLYDWVNEPLEVVKTEETFDVTVYVYAPFQNVRLPYFCVAMQRPNGHSVSQVVNTIESVIKFLRDWSDYATQASIRLAMLPTFPASTDLFAAKPFFTLPEAPEQRGLLTEAATLKFPFVEVANERVIDTFLKGISLVHKDLVL